MKNHPFVRRLLPLFTAALLLWSLASAAESSPAPGAPIPQDQSFETCKNVAYTGRLTATDPQGDPVTFQITRQPARGRVALSEDGSGEFVYTPYENKTGKDSFTFTAADSDGNLSKPATVSLRIRKPSTKVNYADMEGERSHNAAIRLAETGVYVGEKVGESYYFHPQETVSRGEFVAMSMSALGPEPLEDVTATGFADDDAIPTWCKGYLASALQAGLVRGYPAEGGRVVFSPEAVMTRGEAAVMLDRMLSVSEAAVTTFYPDTASAPAWCFQAAVNLESVGVLSTEADGALALDTPLTRGEAARLLTGAMELVEARETTGWFFF